MNGTGRLIALVGFSALISVVTDSATNSALAQQQPSEKTPLEIEAEEAKLREQIAASNLNAAKAKQDLEKLEYAISSFKPEQPSVSVKEQGGYFGELLSFLTLDTAAKTFVETIVKDKIVTQGDPIVVTSDFELSRAGALWHLTDRKLHEFEEMFPRVFRALPDPDAEALPATIAMITAGLGAVTELAAFFRLKRELLGREISPSSESLVALTVKQLSEQQYKPRIPPLVMTYDTKLGKRIDDVLLMQNEAKDRQMQRKKDLKAAPVNIDIDRAIQEIADLKKKLSNDPNNVTLKDRLTKLEFYKHWWDRESSSLQAASDGFAKFIARLETVPEKATQSPLELLFAYEGLIGDSAKILVARVVSQGADVETSSGALRSTKISYVGGSACIFYLSEANGDIVKADVIPILASQSFSGRIDSAPPKRLE